MKTEDWDKLTLPEKTVVYFAKTNLDRVWQARWWNNWREAFDWFEWEFCHDN